MKPIRLSAHALGYIQKRGFTEAEVDALSITFRETTVTSKDLAEGIAANYDGEGRLAGIKIGDAVKRLDGREVLQNFVLEASGRGRGRCPRLRMAQAEAHVMVQPRLDRG